MQAMQFIVNQIKAIPAGTPLFKETAYQRARRAEVGKAAPRQIFKNGNNNPKTKQLTARERKRVKTLREQGDTIRAISEKTGHSTRTIQNILSSWKEK